MSSDEVIPLPVRDRPIFERVWHGLSVHVYGNAHWWNSPRLREWRARSHATTPETAAVITVSPPTPHNNHQGRCSIITPNSPGTYDAEGATLPSSNSVGVTWMRDCHFLVVFNFATGQLGFAHIGRDSLLAQTGCEGCTAGVVSNLLQAVCPAGSDRRTVIALYGGGICREHFTHDDPTALQAIARHYPTAVGGLGPYYLDIPEVIKQQLSGRGVKPSHLRYWNTCSFENSNLGSKRAEAAGMNNKVHQNVLVVTRR